MYENLVFYIIIWYYGRKHIVTTPRLETLKKYKYGIN